MTDLKMEEAPAARRLLDLLHQINPGSHHSDLVADVQREAREATVQRALIIVGNARTIVDISEGLRTLVDTSGWKLAVNQPLGKAYLDAEERLAAAERVLADGILLVQGPADPPTPMDAEERAWIERAADALRVDLDP